jgi:peptidyl-dipeptidase A
MAQTTKASTTAPQAAATPEEARKFPDDAEQPLLKLWVDQGRADWVKSTFITDDTEILAAQFADRSISAAVKYAKEAAVRRVKTDEATARKLRLLKLSLTLAAPADPAESAEVTRIATAMEGVRQGQVLPGEGHGSLPGSRGHHEGHGDVARREAAARRVGRVAHDLAADQEGLRPLRELANKGPRARLQGHGGDVAVEVRHAARPVRGRARPALGAGAAALSLAPRLRALEVAREIRRRRAGVGPIPAHLLGNMWARTWDNVCGRGARRRRPGLRPLPNSEVAQDRTDPDGQKYGEGFFTSLGFDPLPQASGSGRCS